MGKIVSFDRVLTVPADFWELVPKLFFVAKKEELAQMVEQVTADSRVCGSNPTMIK